MWYQALAAAVAVGTPLQAEPGVEGPIPHPAHGAAPVPAQGSALDAGEGGGAACVRAPAQPWGGAPPLAAAEGADRVATGKGGRFSATATRMELAFFLPSKLSCWLVRGASVSTSCCPWGAGTGHCMRPLAALVDHVSCIMYHVSCIMYHVSCIMYHVSCIMYHVSCIMYHVSCIMYHVSCIMYHVSCIMYHVSCIMYHVSCIMYGTGFLPLPPALARNLGPAGSSRVLLFSLLSAPGVLALVTA